MGYEHNIDIGSGTMNVHDLNEGMSTVSNRIMFALDKLTSLDDEFRLTLRFLIKSYLTTHECILVILRNKNEEKFDGDEGRETNLLYGPDAMSLVREQIEKVFIVSLLCSDPIKWSSAYLRDDWRRLYENQLHQKGETINLERFREFNDKIAPDLLEKIRQREGITDLQKEWVEFKFSSPNQPLPQHLQGTKIEKFPMPHETIRYFTGRDQEECLTKFYREYKFISGYTHSGHLKLQMLMMSDRLFRNTFTAEEKNDYFQKQILGPSVALSFVSSLTACTEVIDHFLKSELEITAGTILQWNKLKGYSLFAKAIWDLRASKVLSMGLS
jgi:hypothetical protein